MFGILGMGLPPTWSPEAPLTWGGTDWVTLVVVAAIALVIAVSEFFVLRWMNRRTESTPTEPPIELPKAQLPKAA